MHKILILLISLIIFTARVCFAETVLIDDFQDIYFVNYYEKQYNDLYGDVGWGSDVEEIDADPDWELYRPGYAISTIDAGRVSDEYLGDGWQGGALKISYKQVYDYYYIGGDGIGRYLDGYAYFYESLVPESITKRKTNWINGNNYEYLSFWIKIKSGAADFAVQFELASGTKTSAIPLTYYLQTATIDSEGWKKIVIPMDKFIEGTSITTQEFSKLQSLGFDFSYHPFTVDTYSDTITIQGTNYTVEITVTNDQKIVENNSQGIFYIDNIMLKYKKGEDDFYIKKKGDIIKEFKISDPTIVGDSKKAGYLGANQPLVYDKVPIYINLLRSATVELKIYDKAGRIVKHFEPEDLPATPADDYKIYWWDIKEIPPGIYLVYVYAKGSGLEDRLKSSFLLIR